MVQHSILTKLPISIYKDILKKYRLEESNVLFDNDTHEHAKALISELAKSAKDNGLIQIHSTVFCNTIFDSLEVKEALRDASTRGVRLEVKTIATKDKLGAAINTYSNIFMDNFKLTENVKIFDAQNEQLNNFMVVDKTGLRYEQELYPLENMQECHNQPRPNMNAIACFNDIENAGALSSFFEKQQ